MGDPISPFSASLEGIVAALKAQAGAERGPAPVHLWNPDHCGDIGMEILADGTWVHDGTRITREALVRLFATILRKDADGQTYLVTPHERIVVRVADAPFLAVRADVARENGVQTVLFTTNMGDVAAAGPDHPIRVTFDPDTGEPRPYVLIRGRLEARILRAPFFELADWAEARGGRMVIESGGAAFDLGPA